jgi:hypothetical protein
LPSFDFLDHPLNSHHRKTLKKFPDTPFSSTSFKFLDEEFAHRFPLSLRSFARCFAPLPPFRHDLAISGRFPTAFCGFLARRGLDPFRSEIRIAKPWNFLGLRF